MSEGVCRGRVGEARPKRPGEIMETSRQETRGLEPRPGSRVGELAGAGVSLVRAPKWWCCSRPGTAIKAREQILGEETRLLATRHC